MFVAVGCVGMQLDSGVTLAVGCLVTNMQPPFSRQKTNKLHSMATLTIAPNSGHTRKGFKCTKKTKYK